MIKIKNKIVAIINKNIEIGTAMNTLAHISFGMGVSIENKDDARLTNYNDGDGNDHKNISEMHLIVLRANSNKIRKTRNAAIEKGIKYVDFTDTMTIGTYQEQIAKSAQTKEEELIYYGIILFGEGGIVSEITKKFSLWK